MIQNIRVYLPTYKKMHTPHTPVCHVVSSQLCFNFRVNVSHFILGSIRKKTRNEWKEGRPLPCSGMVQAHNYNNKKERGSLQRKSPIAWTLLRGRWFPVLMFILTIMFLYQ